MPLPKFTPQQLAEIFNEAKLAGQRAGKAAQPQPFRAQATVVGGGQISTFTGILEDGPCGFAWVTIHPANCRAAKFATRFLGARLNGYEGGTTIWIDEYNQSLERKPAHAQAFAAVLNAHGIEADARSRID